MKTSGFNWACPHRPRQAPVLLLLLLLLTVVFLIFLASPLLSNFGVANSFAPNFVSRYVEEVLLKTAPGDSLDSFGRHVWFDGSRDVSGYDVEEVSRWYSGSACNGLSGQWVGHQPLFDPCTSDLHPGLPTWGQFPYMKPEKFMNRSKNPCWWRNGTVMCMPYFFLIGVSKSGTSDLFFRLTSHPQVVASIKEPHFFDRFRYKKGETFNDYSDIYSDLAKRVQIDIQQKGYSDRICGDGSPSYFFDNYRWEMYSGNENCTEPRVISANHIYYLNPNVKIVMIIRHPVHRLYSRYLFDHDRHSLKELDPPSPDKFHNYVVDGLRKYKDCFQRWSLRHCVYNKTLYEAAHKLRIQENLYPVFLEDWLRVVPLDQFIFIRFEDYAKDMASQLRRVYQFLGLESLSEEQMDTVIHSKSPQPGARAKRVGPMLPHTEQILQEFYQPFIRRFAAMLNNATFLWEDLDSD